VVLVALVEEEHNSLPVLVVLVEILELRVQMVQQMPVMV
jgi:hypothetical protein